MTKCAKCSTDTDLFTCTDCRREVCSRCSIVVEGEHFCVPCWFSYVDTLQTSASEPVLQGDWIPWQKWQEAGISRSFCSTIKMLSLQPERMFSLIPTKGNFTTPIIFALLCILLFWFPMKVFYLKVAMPYMLNLVDSAQMANDAAASAFAIPEETREQYQKVAELPYYLILYMPFDFLVFYVLLASAMQQLLIMLFQGKNGYLATLQIRCYTMGAQCLQLIPFFGIILSEMVVLLLCTRGFQTVQNLSRWRAFLVASVPLWLSLALTF